MAYYTDYPSKPIGRGNPYWACSHCGAADPHINGRVEGHHEWCEYRIAKTEELRLLEPVKPINPSKPAPAPKPVGQRPRLPRSARCQTRT